MPFSWKDERTPPGYANETLPCRLCAKQVLPSTAGKTGGLCLDCSRKETRRLEQEARDKNPGCPACDGSTREPTIAFAWDRAKEGKDGNGKYPRYLRPMRKVKGGSRFACSECSASWFLPASEMRLMTWVPPDNLAVFDRWCENRIELPAQLLPVARAIGATPLDFDCRVENLEIPCRVTTRSGEVFDPAVLKFSWLPPLPGTHESPNKLPRYRLADEIAAISPSPLALSANVRCAGVITGPTPVDRDWIDTAVIARNGRVYRLPRGTLFYDRDGAIGSELRLTGKRGGQTFRGQPHSAVTVFAADWFEGARGLCIPTGVFGVLFSLLRSMVGRS